MSMWEQARASGRSGHVVPRPSLISAVLLVALVACGNPRTPAPGSEGNPAEAAAPFTVREDSEGLLFVYGDAEGFHPVERLTDVPAAARGRVRVDSLAIPPERRLDPSQVYVADLRTPGSDGTYPVRIMSRASFEASFGGSGRGAEPGAEGVEAAAAPSGTGEVIVYGASWCGACRAAEAFFRSRGIAFVEKDIEREPGAREEMLAKARAAGIDGSSIPVIDFRGTMLQGFDQSRLESLLGSRRGPSTL